MTMEWLTPSPPFKLLRVDWLVRSFDHNQNTRQRQRHEHCAHLSTVHAFMLLQDLVHHLNSLLVLPIVNRICKIYKLCRCLRTTQHGDAGALSHQLSYCIRHANFTVYWPELSLHLLGFCLGRCHVWFFSHEAREDSDPRGRAAKLIK